MTEISVTCDLRHLFGPVRDQGARPTCLAFAASSAHAALRDGWIPLSCEYLFYHAQRRGDRLPMVGATLSSVLDALRQEGQPEEAGWPYLPKSLAEPESWRPPDDVGPVFRRTGKVRRDTVDEIISELRYGRPVLVLMTLSPSFFMVGSDGVVNPAPGEMPEQSQRHAVVAVGHGEALGQRAILVRNSWGEAWGETGHAWLTENFLLPRLFRLAILTEDPDVSPCTAAG